MYFVEPPFVVGFFDYALGIRNRKRVVNELLIFSSVASNENNKPSENNEPTGKKEPKVWYSLKSHLNLDFSFALWLFVSKAKRMNKNGFLASIPMAWRDCVFFFSRPPQFHVMDTFQRTSMCAFFIPLWIIIIFCLLRSCCALMFGNICVIARPFGINLSSVDVYLELEFIDGSHR